MDTDVLSLELPETFKECHVENVMTNMLNVARALVTMQFLYGVIPNVYGKGKCAKVFQLLDRYSNRMKNMSCLPYHVLSTINQ